MKREMRREVECRDTETCLQRDVRGQYVRVGKEINTVLISVLCDELYLCGSVHGN